MPRSLSVALALLAILAAVGAEPSVVRAPRRPLVAEVFCDGMVLQRDAPVPVWGWTEPGSRVTVVFAGQEKAVDADPAGAWSVVLDPMPACAESRVLRVTAGTNIPKEIADVLVGDVWLCSGQSNMVFAFGASKRPADMALDYPLIREFTAPRSIALEPTAVFRPTQLGGELYRKHFLRTDEYEVPTRWRRCTPSTAGQFSAVALFAAIEMYGQLQIPIGIVNCSHNGSSAIQWIPTDVLREDAVYEAVFPAADKALASFQANVGKYEEDQARFLAVKAEFDAATNVAEAAGAEEASVQPDWFARDAETKDWSKLTWGWPYGKPSYIWDGPSTVFFRTLCVVTANHVQEGDITLTGGTFANCQTEYYFNGRRLDETGRTNSGCPQFVIGRDELKNNQGILAVRATTGHRLASAGPLPSAREMLVLFEQRTQYTVAGWQGDPEGFRIVGHKYPPRGATYPGCLYNAMLQPLVPYQVRGVLWYQGESEWMGGMEQAKRYAHTLPLLVRAWRDLWGGGEKAFVVVQLASCIGNRREPALAQSRESQKAVLALPATVLSPAMDIREPNDAHPRNKYDIGTRAGRAMLAVTGQVAAEWSGPLFRKLTVDGDTVRVEFDHVADGLVLGEKDGLDPVAFLPDLRVPHFEVAGADGKFFPAEAIIDGTAVRVRSDEVPVPVAVRYAWTNMPANPLLYNRAGLPACSFRTDRTADR